MGARCLSSKIWLAAGPRPVMDCGIICKPQRLLRILNSHRSLPMTIHKEVTVGIGGAAGDGLDKSGDTIAKTCSRLGLYLCAYNSYQSVIRGGHIWLRVRIGEQKVYSHGDELNLLIALNQDSIERHAREVASGGAIIYNSDKLKCDPALVGDHVLPVPLPIAELTQPFGR